MGGEPFLYRQDDIRHRGNTGEITKGRVTFEHLPGVIRGTAFSPLRLHNLHPLECINRFHLLWFLSRAEPLL